MRVLMTTDTIGGVWNYAVELAGALASRGVDVVLATMGAPLCASQRRQAEALDEVVIHESRYRLEWMNEPWDDVRAAGRWLLAIEHDSQPDIVHLNTYAHAELPFDAPTLVVGHSCVLSWWEAVRCEPAPPQWDRYRHEVTSGLRRAGMVVAPSHAMLAALHRHYGSMRSSRVIYNARSPQHYGASTGKEEVVFSAGRLWDQAKNIAALQAVAPRLPWPVCVAGDDRHPDGGDINTRNLVMLGRIDEPAMADSLRRASIFASPARYEPFGLAALEAAISGCALVLGDIPSLREIWGDAALYVPPDATDALEAALIALIGDPSLRNDMACCARARAARYSTAVMTDQYLLAYQWLLGTGNAMPLPGETPWDFSTIAALE